MRDRSLREMIVREQTLTDPGIEGERTRIIRTFGERQPKRSTFVVEAMLLFMCLMVVIAVSISVIAFAASMGAHSAHKEAGVIMATNIAEQFSADPSSLQERYVDGDYTATCTLELSMDEAGTLYDATIVVDWRDEEIYTLRTAEYVSHADVDPSDVLGSLDDGRVM